MRARKGCVMGLFSFFSSFLDSDGATSIAGQENAGKAEVEYGVCQPIQPHETWRDHERREESYNYWKSQDSES